MSNVISFDYDSILQRLRENFKSKSEWADFLSYSVIDNLISPIAQELAYAVRYEMTAQDIVAVPHVANDWSELIRTAAERLE